MATVGAKKTIRDLIFKDKRHKDFQESEKINFANKGIVKLILLYTVSSIFSVAQRDWQYKRNIEKLILENKTQKIHLIEQLREKIIGGKSYNSHVKYNSVFDNIVLLQQKNE